MLGVLPFSSLTEYMKLSLEFPVIDPISSNSISVISAFLPCKRVSGPVSLFSMSLTLSPTW